MPTLLVILAHGALVSSLVLGGFWGIAIFRMLRSRILVPTLRRGLALDAGRDLWPSLVIVVPAHNEGTGPAGRQSPIASLVRSIRTQDYPRLRLVLALDRCTDNTHAQAQAAIGADARCRIVTIDSCPEDWAGKVHAVVRAMEASPETRESDLLLFADADTVFEPGCLRAAVSLMEHRDIELLTLLSTLTHDRWFERIAQPVAGLELARQHPLSRVNRRTGDPSGRRAFANGQFMLFRREFYERLGGHAAVRDQILEDLALARAAQELGDRSGAGGNIGLFLADGLLRCRMYDSPASFREGWKRIFIESAKRRPGRLVRSSLVIRFFGCVLPVLSLLSLVLPVAVPALYVPVVLGRWPHVGALWLFLSALALAHWMGRAPIWSVVLHPIGAWQVANILSGAARALRRREPIRWAGRDYVLEPR